MEVECIAKALHEAGRSAVIAGQTLNPTGAFVEWGELPEHAREGRRTQAKWLLERYELRQRSADELRYAVVEQIGHRRFVGAVREVQQYGAIYCEVRPLRPDGSLDTAVLLGAQTLFAQREITRDEAVRLVRPYLAPMPALPAPEEDANPEF
jgi:hypothetical protein